MVSWNELIARVKTDLRFTRMEIPGLLAAVFVTAFIFSFRDWGEPFNAIVGLRNLFIMILIVGVTFFFRIACQKTYGLSEGHGSDFRIWWTGLGIMLLVSFVSVGYVPLVLIGSMVSTFMVRHRLGEFRYGFSYYANAIIAYWGVLGNLILAVLFGFGLYYSPQSYFFSQGLKLNLIMAFTSLLPLPQLDGFNILFGSRLLYSVAIAVAILAAILLLSKTLIGLTIALTIGILYALVYTLIGSEK